MSRISGEVGEGVGMLMEMFSRSRSCRIRRSDVHGRGFHNGELGHGYGFSNYLHDHGKKVVP